LVIALTKERKEQAIMYRRSVVDGCCISRMKKPEFVNTPEKIMSLQQKKDGSQFSTRNRKNNKKYLR
jgi:hypothetical protein